MAARVRPAQSLPLGLTAPFFLLAPIGLIAGGVLLSVHDSVVFVAINHPHTVAVTHAIILGWLTTTIMGATYQLAPVVLGGELLSIRAARVQLIVHIAGISWFVWSLFYWNRLAMVGAATALVLSFLLYVVNMGVGVARGTRWTLPRAYVAVALGFLMVTAGLGVVWVLNHHQGWFPITLGRLSAHAHLGLVGWLGLMVMGVSYQLVPMFSVINRARPKFGWLALIITALSVVVFAAVIFTDPPMWVRLIGAVLLSAGPVLWAVDIVRLFRQRSRRRLDIHGHATIVSLVFLGLAVALGLAAATGTPLISNDEPARLLLAYAAAAILGFVGTPLIGNSYKVLPFLIWYHRYRSRIGLSPIPVVDDIYSGAAAHAVLGLHAAATVLLIGGALFAQLVALQVGGVLLAASAAAHLLTMVHMFFPKQSSRQRSIARSEVLAR
jgi:hypothetical protein